MFCLPSPSLLPSSSPAYLSSFSLPPPFLISSLFIFLLPPSSLPHLQPIYLPSPSLLPSSSPAYLSSFSLPPPFLISSLFPRSQRTASISHSTRRRVLQPSPPPPTQGQVTSSDPLMMLSIGHMTAPNRTC